MSKFVTFQTFSKSVGPHFFYMSDENVSGWRSLCCGCRKTRTTPRKKKTVTYATLPHDEHATAANNSPKVPVSIENENYVSPKDVAQTPSTTSKKNIELARRRLRQKMKLMVKPALYPQTSDDLLAVRRAQDIWEGDTYLRILAEYQETKGKDDKVAAATTLVAKKSVTFSEENEVSTSTGKVKRETYEEIYDDTLSGASGSVELASFLIQEDDAWKEGAPPTSSQSSVLDEEDAIKLECDACGTSTLTTFSQLSKQKHILPFLHSANKVAGSESLDTSSKLGFGAERVTESDGSHFDKNADVKVLEIVMNKAKFPCLNDKS